MKALSILALSLFTAAPAPAQLAPPNDFGVTVGHIHLAVKDVDAQKRFFTEALGGTEVKNGTLSLIQFPGVYIMLRQADPTGPPAGSIVNHFGFVVKDLPGMIAKWKAMGVPFDQGQVNPNQGYVNGPDGIRIEVFGDPDIPTAVRMDHIHFYPVDIPAMQAWYAMTFGGVVGRRAQVSRPGWIDTNELPGVVNLSFSAGGATPLSPTKGRALDHIGFEVRNLEAFCKALEANGIKFDMPLRQLPDSKTKIAFFTDPWGTYIELTENLAPSSSGSR